MTNLHHLNFDRRLRRLIRRETRRGKTLGRTLMNYLVSQQRLTGRILDLGAKSNSASYNRFLNLQPPSQITYTDLYASGVGLLKLDLEQIFPLDSASFDYLLCFNALEHVFNHQNVLNQSYRVLKPGGRLIGSTPFLVNYHPDPQDFFRYTHEALDRLLTAAGFSDIVIYYLGGGPLTAAFNLSDYLWPSWLRPFVISVCLATDRILIKLKPVLRGRYAESYFFTASKI